MGSSMQLILYFKVGKRTASFIQAKNLSNKMMRRVYCRVKETHTHTHSGRCSLPKYISNIRLMPSGARENFLFLFLRPFQYVLPPYLNSYDPFLFLMNFSCVFVDELCIQFIPSKQKNHIYLFSLINWQNREKPHSLLAMIKNDIVFHRTKFFHIGNPHTKKNPFSIAD